MDLNWARTFVAVYETRSFSRGAQRLGVPRSTASRAVAALEDSLHVRLFQRTTRAVSVTNAANALYDRLAPSLQSLELALHDVPGEDEEPAGTLRITSIADLAVSVLAEAAARFTARYPHVEVDVHTSPQLVDLVRDGFDLALRIYNKRRRDSTLVSRRVGVLAGGLYASPAYLARAGTPRTPSELAAHDWVAFRPMPTRLLGPVKLPVPFKARRRIVCADPDFARAALHHGGGIGELPLFLAEPDVASGLLVRVLPRWLTTAGTIYLVRPGAKQVPRRVSAFTAILDDLLRQRPDLRMPR